MIRCLFGHDTRIRAKGEEGQIVCKWCGAVLDRWPLLRPEIQIARERHDQKVRAERERRAAEMQAPERPRLVRMR